MEKKIKNKMTYVEPTIDVIQMEEHCGLCNFTMDKSSQYGPQLPNEDGTSGHHSSSFDDDYGDLFGASAKPLGAKPVGESTYESLKHDLD